MQSHLHRMSHSAFFLILVFAVQRNPLPAFLCKQGNAKRCELLHTGHVSPSNTVKHFAHDRLNAPVSFEHSHHAGKDWLQALAVIMLTSSTRPSQQPAYSAAQPA